MIEQMQRFKIFSCAILDNAKFNSAHLAYVSLRDANLDDIIEDEGLTR